jgi:hypothetical protein
MNKGVYVEPKLEEGSLSSRRDRTLQGRQFEVSKDHDPILCLFICILDIITQTSQTQSS